MQIDNLDKQIINFLILDGEMSNAEIAKKMNVSPGTIHLRIKHLKKAGIITGHALKVDYTELGYETSAFVAVYLKRSNMYVKVVNELKMYDEVLSIDYVTGPFNILIRVLCRDNEHLHELLHEQIQEIDGVEKTESYISLYTSVDRSKTI